MSNRKFGQAGLDFLMTYGWALLIIVLVIGVLFALGIFNVSSFSGSRASGFPQVGVTAWRVYPSGTFSVIFQNRVGSPINITNVTYQFDNQAAPTTVSNQSLWNGGSSVLSVGSSTVTSNLTTTATGYNAGDSYSVRMSVAYIDTKTGFVYTDSGTLTGKAN